MGSPVRGRASTFTDTFGAAFTDAVITISGHDAGTAAPWIQGANAWAPHDMIGSRHPQATARSTLTQHASSGLMTSRSTESAAPVHGRFGSLYRTARVSLLCFAGGSTDRARAVAIQSAIAARLTIPWCDRVVGESGVPAYVAYLHRGVTVSVFGSRRLDIDLGRHE
ncbi:MAG: hypothetical protein K0S98_2996 [Propionibacteriaceae bacterium]|jgi:hypothetical protein|nr:hypothetical protein [Propionibacteriaceae bacterium]